MAAVLAGVFASAGGSAWAAGKAIPKAPDTHLYDEAGFTSADGAQTLRALLSDHAHATSDQIVYAVFKSLEGEDLEDYVNRVFRAWRIGQARENNGVLVALFLDDRKIRIEVGYGLEPVLTDAQSKRIINEAIVPEIRAGKNDQALLLSAAQILRVLDSPLVQQGKVDALMKSKGYQPSYRTLKMQLSRSQIFILWIVLLGLLTFLRSILNRAAGDAHLSRSGWHHRRSGFPIVFGGGPRSGGGWGSSGGGGFSGGGGRSGGGGASGGW